MAAPDDYGVSVGCPPPSSSLGLRGQQWKSFQFHFHDFAALGTKKNKCIVTPKFTCNGHQWQLQFYPGGHSSATEGYMSIFLNHLSEGIITADYQFDIMDKFGRSCGRCGKDDVKFPSKNSFWGWLDFISRSDIVDESKNILDSDGALIIIVSMTEVEATTVFVPQNPFLKMMKEMYKLNDNTTADVCFEVVICTDKKKGRRKKSKEMAPLHAHRSILSKCAPLLADLLGSKNTATITDIKPEIFYYLLYYVYGNDIPKSHLQIWAKDFIDAADKYSIVNLKLAAEAAYVESTDITFENVIDNLLYADAKNLALLKEEVMNFLADNHYEAAEKISFTDCPSHVMKDLLLAVGRNSRKDSTETNVDKLTTLGVSALRRKLDELGLEVDGSRETMIESIKAHSSSPPSSSS